MVPQVVDRRAPAIQRLRQAAAIAAAAEAAQAQAIHDLAAEVEWDEDAEFTVVGTRPVRIGAGGTRLVDEHLPVEIAAALGMSVDAAIWLIRDVLNLAARHPRTWQAVQAGRVPVWRARRIAQTTETAGLDRSECLQVDKLIAPALGVVGWRRLAFLVRAAMLKVAPAKLRATAEAARADRYLRTGTVTDDPGSSWVAGRLDTYDARGFDHLLDELAAALAARGEPGERDQLRARAIGVIADDLTQAALLLDAYEPGRDPAGDAVSERAGAAKHERIDSGDSDTLAVAPPRRRRSRAPHQVYVHLPAHLGPDAVAAVEGVGPVLADQLKPILGDRPIRVTPVLQVGGEGPAVDSYEIPHRIREDVLVRDRFEVFPFSSRRARSTDLDHTIPYVPGGAEQTRPGNLGPLSRRPHRAKTHGGWQLSQPRPGVFWWRSPRGQIYRVSAVGVCEG